MGNNTVISLPLHVRNTYLLQVIAKVVGQQWAQEGSYDTKTVINLADGRSDFINAPRPFDATQPASRENAWSIDFAQRNKGFSIDFSNSKEAGHGSMDFVDACGNPHSWYFHAENEDEVEKSLRPGVHGLAVAVGRRVVKFFGGRLVENDFHEEVSLKVSNAHAVFPKKLATQSSDDRWYQFHNALHAEPRLTASELGAAMDQHGSNELHRELFDYLQKLEYRDHLEEVLPRVEAGRAKPRL